jgi:hypothetical protein
LPPPGRCTVDDMMIQGLSSFVTSLDDLRIRSLHLLVLVELMMR